MHNETNATKLLIDYLIRLYAIVPSVVITLMYSFLANVEMKLGELYIGSGNIFNHEIDEQLSPVRRFVFISSKVLHLTMSYYLCQLLYSMFILLASLSSSSNLVKVGIPTTFYFVYALSYIARDIIGNGLSELFGDNSNKQESMKPLRKHILRSFLISFNYLKSKILCKFIDLCIFIVKFTNLSKKSISKPSPHTRPRMQLCIIGFLVSFCILPIFVLLFNQDEIKRNIFWISLSLFYLTSWWLLFPFKYKPLTNLAIAMKKIAYRKYSFLKRLEQTGSENKNKDSNN